MDRPRVIVVDDADIFREAISEYLSRNGLSVSQAGSGAEARRLFAGTDFDVAILDLGLPDEDGLDLVRDLGASRRCGIIVLTANADPTDAVVGLELGADDYLVKPHSNRELLARVRTVLRRTEPQREARRQPPPEARATFGGWAIDAGGRCLRGPAGDEFQLTRSEFSLVSELARRPGRPVDRETLSQGVFRRAWEYGDRSLDILVTRLRKKLSAVGLGGEIRSVRGAGYMVGDVRRSAGLSSGARREESGDDEADFSPPRP